MGTPSNRGTSRLKTRLGADRSKPFFEAKPERICMNASRRSASGFTLVEIMIVIAIIA